MKQIELRIDIQVQKLERDAGSFSCTYKKDRESPSTLKHSGFLLRLTGLISALPTSQ